MFDRNHLRLLAQLRRWFRAANAAGNFTRYNVGQLFMLVLEADRVSHNAVRFIEGENEYVLIDGGNNVNIDAFDGIGRTGQMMTSVVISLDCGDHLVTVALVKEGMSFTGSLMGQEFPIS
jgi:hypothetical protein